MSLADLFRPTPKRLRVAAARAELAEARAREAAARLQHRQVTAIAGSFPAGRRSRWRAEAGGGPEVSAERHRDVWTRDAARADCRRVYRERALAQNLVHALSSILIGEGPKVLSRADDDEWAKLASDRFAAWFADRDAYDAHGRLSGLDALIAGIKAVCTDGRLGRVFTADGRVALVEDERIINPGGGDDGHTHSDGRVWIAGIGHAGGRADRVHISEYDHQGYTVRPQGRVLDARAVRCLLNPLDMETGVVAPMPALAPIIDDLDKLHRAMDAAIINYEIAASFTILFKHPRDQLFAQQLTRPTTTGGYGGGIQPSAPDWASAKSMQGAPVKPGTMFVGPEGFDGTQIRPEHPSGPIVQFVWQRLQHIASLFGLPLEIVSLYFSRNFSASRGAIAVMEQRISPWRQMLTDDLAAQFRWKIAWDVRHGHLPEPPGDWRRCAVELPPPPVYDALVETDIVEKQLALGLTDLDAAARRLGHQDGYAAVLAGQKAVRKMREQAEAAE